jgi:hypothetical protein
MIPEQAEATFMSRKHEDLCPTTVVGPLQALVPANQSTKVGDFPRQHRGNCDLASVQAQSEFDLGQVIYTLHIDLKQEVGWMLWGGYLTSESLMCHIHFKCNSCDSLSLGSLEADHEIGI